MKSRIYILLLSLICTQIALYPAAAPNNNQPLAMHPEHREFVRSAAVGFTIPAMLDWNNANGTKYTATSQWTRNDSVDKIMHMATSLTTNTVHAYLHGPQESTVLERTQRTLKSSAFWAFLMNMWTSFRATHFNFINFFSPTPDGSSFLETSGAAFKQIAQDHSTACIIGALAAGASALTYEALMKKVVLPQLQSTDEQTNALPLICRNPRTLSHILIPTGIMGASTFAYNATVNPDMSVSDNVKRTALTTAQTVNRAYIQALQTGQKSGLAARAFFTVAPYVEPFIPLSDSTRRGIAFGQSSYLLGKLLVQHDKIFASPTYIKIIAALSAGTLLTRMGWLTYKQRQSINDAQHPAA